MSGFHGADDADFVMHAPTSDAPRTTLRGRQTRSRPRHLLVWVLLLVGGAFLSACHPLAVQRWEWTRRGVIDPLNTKIHRHFPGDIKKKDLHAILETFETTHGEGVIWAAPPRVDWHQGERRSRWETGGSESLEERYRTLLGLFDEVDKAEVRIHRVHWREPDADGAIPTDARMLVRGTGGDGLHRRVDQRMRLWLVERDGEFRIRREEILSRELLESATPVYEVATAAAGVEDLHDISRSPRFRLIGDMAAAAGAAVGDFDCDGWEDLAWMNTTSLSLQRNRGDGTFEWVSDRFGVGDELDIVGSGLVFFDMDNDGDPDLWLAGLRGERLLRNEDCREFVDVTAESGLPASTWSSMPVVADYDGDGLLDVYVVRMGDHETAAPVPNWDATNGTRDSLYRNLGDGRFVDTAQEVGIDETGWGLAGAWGDYDNDGDPDLYVGNEFGFNALYRNDDGRFVDVAEQAGTLDRGAAMGIAWGDYDNDGFLDLFVSNMYANSRWAMFHPDYPSPVPWYLQWVPRSEIDRITDELTRGSSLLRNRGDGTFDDVSEEAGVRDGQWGWAAEFLDYDNDGDLDLYAVNGFISGPIQDDV